MKLLSDLYRARLHGWRMYGKEAATPPSAFSRVRVSGPLFLVI
ncbi:hypothetical protein [Janthinobacterium sp. J1-1]|nr:hypothetical protein [Janthinobacterium sp. J1-1]